MDVLQFVEILRRVIIFSTLWIVQPRFILFCYKHRMKKQNLLFNAIAPISNVMKTTTSWLLITTLTSGLTLGLNSGTAFAQAKPPSAKKAKVTDSATSGSASSSASQNISQDGAYPLPVRERADLPQPVKEEKVFHVKTARVVWANYDLIKEDFPEMRKKTNAQIDKWLESQAVISEAQTQQTEFNTPMWNLGGSAADFHKALEGLMKILWSSF